MVGLFPLNPNGLVVQIFYSIFINKNMEKNSIKIKELNKDNIKPFSIFYKIVMHSFLDEKYKYYRVYIKDDIFTENHNDILTLKHLLKEEKS